MIGEVIGNYRVVAELGKGGMGVVYRADHVQLGRPAALKMLLPQLSSDPGIVQRFFNEARAASAIDHPGIVEIYDFGTHTDGRAYIVMALLKGETLDQRVASGPLSPLEGATIVAQVAGALAAAHARGIVHRDLKPDNIFLVPNELMPNGIQVKLLDFGIAKLGDDTVAGVKTQTGMMIGTPAYMSPEQCMGKPDLDHRTDLYSVGCILFHVLCGRPPFSSDQGTGMMIAAHLRDPAPHPRSIDPAIPDALAAIVLRLLEKEPAARFQTAAELRAALVAAGANAPATRPPAKVDPIGATMVSMATAPTTGAGAASEVVRTAPPPVSKRGLWIGSAVAAIAIAGVATVAAVQHGSATAPPLEAARPVAPAPAPAPALAPAEPAKLAECPAGQVRTADTQSHCCWQDQAWSNAKGRCVGIASCPHGMIAKADGCLAAASTALTAPTKVPPLVASDAPELHLSGTTFVPGSNILIRLSAPISSKPTDRAWITLVEADKPASDYGTWGYLDDGEVEAHFKAPAKLGAYQIRLHTNYPAKSFNVRRAVAFEVVAVQPTSNAVTPLAQQKFSLAATSFKRNDKALVTFATALHPAPHERFWITLVATGSADTTWGSYQYVPDGARTIQMQLPATGDYEIRLHANYPAQQTNVVDRHAIHVDD